MGRSHVSSTARIITREWRASPSSGGWHRFSALQGEERSVKLILTFVSDVHMCAASYKQINLLVGTVESSNSSKIFSAHHTHPGLDVPSPVRIPSSNPAFGHPLILPQVGAGHIRAWSLYGNPRVPLPYPGRVQLRPEGQHGGAYYSIEAESVPKAPIGGKETDLFYINVVPISNNFSFG